MHLLEFLSNTAPGAWNVIELENVGALPLISCEDDGAVEGVVQTLSLRC